MFDYLQFDENGKKVVCRMNGVNANMLQDITVYRLKEGQSYAACLEDQETAVLLTEGKVVFEWEADGAKQSGVKRTSF